MIVKCLDDKIFLLELYVDNIVFEKIIFTVEHNDKIDKIEIKINSP